MSLLIPMLGARVYLVLLSSTSTVPQASIMIIMLVLYRMLYVYDIAYSSRQYDYKRLVGTKYRM